MIATGISWGELVKAAQACGVEVVGKTLNTQGTRHRVKVSPFVKGKYQRVSAFSGRKVNAVCWHGFRDFFRECFTLQPNAVFRTALATWKGKEHFEASFAESGWQEVGSEFRPARACDVCKCPEAGEAR
jgi:hypothetical protein